METILYVVIPCFNEADVLPETSKHLIRKYNQLIEQNKISSKSKVLLVDNGSSDDTWKLISELHYKNNLFLGIKIAKNHGHQNGLMAGLMIAREHCNIAITMDADLQDDIDAVDEMVQKYHEGNQVVYGVRSSRNEDTFFKRTTAEWFYKFMKIMGVDIVFNHADYRLMSNCVLDALSKYEEVNMFIRGIIPDIGFKSDYVYYKRHKRFAGKSKYSLKKMIAFAIDGITSFSVRPLRIIACTGACISAISLVALLWFFIGTLLDKSQVIGWSSIMCSIWLLGGLQIFFLGIIGEYIGKIYSETKGRPRYIISDKLLDDTV